MQTECSAKAMGFGRAGGRRVVADFDGGMVSSDAGALLLGETDKAIGLIDRFAACFRDARHPDYVRHEVKTLVAQRVFGLALGYEDLNDHDELRGDPVLGVLLGKLDGAAEASAALAGKSTLNRLEHAPAGSGRTRYHKIGHDGAAIESKRYEKTTAPGGEAYASGLKRIGIQNWRRASTFAGMSRQSCRASGGVPGLRVAGGNAGRPASSTQWIRIGRSRVCSVLSEEKSRDQTRSRSFMTA